MILQVRRLFPAFLLLSISLFVSCRKGTQPAPSAPGTTHTPGPDTTEVFTGYLIKAGNNYCEKNGYPLLTVKAFSFRAIFDSSAIYATVLPENQDDINKLYGFSDSMTHHHRNSARFGWNWAGNALHIHAYTYEHGMRRSKELGTVPLHQAIDYRIAVEPGIYRFTVNGHTDTMTRGSDDTLARGYKLLPYFGGDEPAPHDIVIRIREMP